MADILGLSVNEDACLTVIRLEHVCGMWEWYEAPDDNWMTMDGMPRHHCLCQVAGCQVCTLGRTPHGLELGAQVDAGTMRG